MRWRHWILAAIIGGYAALFGRAVGYAFVWDDVTEIERSAAFDGPLLAGLRATQVERIDPVLAHTSGVVLAYDSYRPVLFASYWLEIRAWGRQAWPMHLDNLAVGALGILLAYALARRLVAVPLALAVTAVFALHPIHVEAVAYISGRGDLFAGVLAMVAALAAVRATEARVRGRRIGWIAAAAVAFALSLLAKESCIGLPVALAAIGWALGKPVRDAAIPGLLLGVAALVVALRATLIATSSNLELGDAIAHLPAVYLDYARAALLPLELSTDRPLTTALAPSWILAGGAVLAAVAAVVRRGWPVQLPAAIAGLVWWAALIAPTAVPILSTRVISDRYMYAPLLGLALAAASGGAELVRAMPVLRRPLIAVAALYGALLVFVTAEQVAVWADELALGLHAVAAVPDSGPAHWRLGNVYAQAGQWDEAITELGVSAELDPANYHALDNLGVALIQRERYAEAEAVLVRAVAASPAPSSYRALFNLGVARLALGQHDAGCASIRRALEVRPGYAAAEGELARSCRR